MLRSLFYWMVRAENTDPKAPLRRRIQRHLHHPRLDPHRQHGLVSAILSSIAALSLTSSESLEQPAGVGFSVDNEGQPPYSTGDKQAQADNYAFVNGFLKLFPEFDGRDIWFTGER